MSYVNRKLKDIKANSIMYFDYGVYNMLFSLIVGKHANNFPV